MNKNFDLTGKRFGRLTAISMVRKSKNGTYVWKCICDCGNETSSYSTSLRSGDSQSCGCLSREKSTTHGLSNHILFHIWYDMMHRCYNTINKYYKDYGGRGIIVCERWKSLDNFIEDMLDSYIVHKIFNTVTQIDRINNDGNYELSNCKWSTAVENNSNTRRNIRFIATDPDGVTYESTNQSEFARIHNLNNSAICGCIKCKHSHHKGWTFKIKGEL